MTIRFFSILLLTTATCFILADSYFNTGYSDPGGAPSAACGSVVNPNTCASSSCHGGTAPVQTGWITSTIPASGYIPGTLYTITATARYIGRSMFGFQISPQNTVGSYLGTCIITNTTTTKLITGTGGNSSRKYVTHKTAGNFGSGDSLTWNFNWTAPAVGSGTLTFYGAFLCANADGEETGDITYKSSLSVNEDITTNIAGLPANENSVSIFPNPVSDYFNVHYAIALRGMVEITLLDIQGRSIAPLLSESKAPGTYSDLVKVPFNLNSGVYFIEITTKTGTYAKRILVQQ